MFCRICGENKLEYSEEYDAEYCPQCLEWAVNKCDDYYCTFCHLRPERPSISDTRYTHDNS